MKKKLFLLLYVKMAIQNWIVAMMAFRFSNLFVWLQTSFMCGAYCICGSVWSVLKLVLLFYSTRFKIRAIHKMAFGMASAIKRINRFVIPFYLRLCMNECPLMVSLPYIHKRIYIKYTLWYTVYDTFIFFYVCVCGSLIIFFSFSTHTHCIRSHMHIHECT